MKLNFNWDYYY